MDMLLHIQKSFIKLFYKMTLIIINDTYQIEQSVQV